MRILKRKFSGQFSYYNNIFNDFLLLIPITSLLYLLTTIFNLSFLFQQQPFLLLLLPLYSINILAIAKNTIFGFQLDKSSKEKLAYYTIFITFLVFYFLYFVASKPKIILAESAGYGLCEYLESCNVNGCLSWHLDNDYDTGYKVCCYNSVCNSVGTPTPVYYYCSYSIANMRCDDYCGSNYLAIDGSPSCDSSGVHCSYSITKYCNDANHNNCEMYTCGGYTYMDTSGNTQRVEGSTVYWCTYDGSTWAWRTSKPAEVCCDGVDNDCDGDIDLNDPDCSSIECCSDSDCNDDNPCTQDTCNNGVCENTNLADGTVLGTGYCYGSQVGICCNGELKCAPGDAEKYCCDNDDCNDDDPCTTDTCNNNVCEHDYVGDGLMGPEGCPIGQMGYCCGGSFICSDGGVCCDGNWIEGGECCSDSDCASKSCDNGVIPICDTNNGHVCACPPCTSSDECAEENACCDTDTGNCVPEGTIKGKYLCDRPEWVLESSLLFKLANENPFSTAE